jgi:thiol-disulfide isomerase/thioredoxin
MGGSKWAVAIAGVVLLAGAGGAALLYANRMGPFKVSAPAAQARSDLARFAVGPLAALETPAAPSPAPDHAFRTREGAETRFADFRGRVVVVNLWAMWCAPCRTEMPTLARLAQAYPGDDLVVLPINVDTGADAIADATSFIDVHEPLPLYSDASFRLPFLFPGKGKMPQTMLLDRQGRVRAAFAGEADWASPEARALIDALLAEPA